MRIDEQKKLFETKKTAKGETLAIIESMPTDATELFKSAKAQGIKFFFDQKRQSIIPVTPSDWY